MSDKTKNKIWEIINSWGPAILTLLFPCIVSVIGYANGLSLTIVCIVFLALITIFIIYFRLFHHHVRAVLYQWRIGKFKGLWKDTALKSQVKKYFLKASQISIKVTRGTELVNTSDNNVNIVEELQILKEKSNESNPVQIRILLMAPCFKIKHVQTRYYGTHEGKYASPTDFLNSWTETFKELVKYENEYCKISVRFYYGGHSRWRFYICSDDEGDKKVVLLGNYDDKTPGSKTPMYKIIKGEKNIGAFMDKYFDEIWKNSINLSELIDSINNDRCIRFFCEECKNCTNNNSKSKISCSAVNCNLHSYCKVRAKEWRRFLDDLSNTQRVNFLGEEF